MATWEGGPQTENRTFATWPDQSLFFVTDPVALDHIGWEIIDRKRRDVGWPIVAQMGLDAHPGVGKSYAEMFTIRQPQHIPLARIAHRLRAARRNLRYSRDLLPWHSVR